MHVIGAKTSPRKYVGSTSTLKSAVEPMLMVTKRMGMIDTSSWQFPGQCIGLVAQMGASRVFR